jgi:hypothetical protein
MLADPPIQGKENPRFGSWGHVLGTVCGPLGNQSFCVAATKKAICWPFLKPSDGLGPSIPSLPWRSCGGNGVHARSLAIAFVLQIGRLACVASARVCHRAFFWCCTRLVPVCRWLFSKQTTVYQGEHARGHAPELVRHGRACAGTGSIPSICDCDWVKKPQR